MTHTMQTPAPIDFQRVAMSARLVGLECLHHTDYDSGLAIQTFPAHATEIIIASLYKRLEETNIPGNEALKNELDGLVCRFEQTVYCHAAGLEYDD